MTLLQSIFLGLLQGLTEFLPISSSGHLILASQLFAVESNLFFVVMLHVGTLLAVIVVYRNTIWEIIRHPIKDKRLLQLVLASIPTFVIAVVIKYLLPPSIMEGIVLPIGFAVTIVLLVVSKYTYQPRKKLLNATVPSLLLVGLTQGLAVFPGLSRSGSTISVMKMCGYTNNDSAQFSFLLSIPVILASAVVESLEVISTPITTAWYIIAIGVLVSFVAGMVAIKAVNTILKKDLWIAFAIYLAIPLVVSIILL